ncbi:MAG: hypothetical protein AAFX85_02310 [Pseudomonadota bacterium]
MRPIRTLFVLAALALLSVQALAGETTSPTRISRLVLTESSLAVNIFLDLETIPDPAGCAGGAGPTRVRLGAGLVSYQQVFDTLLTTLTTDALIRLILDTEACEETFPSVVGLIIS